MAHISEDRVLETTTTVGTGSLALAGAVVGYRAFSGVMALSDTCWYAVWAVDANGEPTGQWETGLGTYNNVNSLSRLEGALESSNAGSTVNFSAGTKYVALTLVAAKTAQFDVRGTMPMPLAAAEPLTPATGVYLYAKELLPGQTVLKVKRPSGVDSPLQDSMAFNKFVKHQGGPTVIVASGGGPLTASATGTAATPAAGTTIRNALSRTQYTTAATANSIVSLYSNAATTGNHVLRGSITGEGGFRVVMRFGISVLTTGARFFAGLRDIVTAPANINPLTSANPGTIGLVANTATDANWNIAHNVTTIAPTLIPLGANFPVNNSDLIELVLFCRPFLVTSGNIGYRVRRYQSVGDASFEASGTLSTNLPAGATLLHPGMWMVNVQAAAATFQVNNITIEGDF